MEKQYIDWREHATQDELARIAELENLRFAHTREKTRIRNRCYRRAISSLPIATGAGE